MKWNPHVHALVTEGGFKQNGEWVDVNFFPFRMLRRSWQYHLLTDIKASLDDTPKSRRLIHSSFRITRKGATCTRRTQSTTKGI